MIKFLKKLFGKKSNVVEEVKVSEPIEFTPKTEIEVFLINEGFVFEGTVLFKSNETSQVSYNLDNGRIIISKSGGNISLLSEGNLSKVKRFLNKYFI